MATINIVEVALKEWSKVVSEPPGVGSANIQGYLDGLRIIAKGAQGKYIHDGDAEWCGAFAGWCAIQAGLLNPEMVKVKSKPEMGDLASTYRMFCLANMAVDGKPHARLITDHNDVQSGDILSVGRLPSKGIRRPVWGEHIVIATGVFDKSGIISTVEGNAYGKLGNGRTGQGVIRRTRPAKPTPTDKGFMFGLRFLTEDFLKGQ
jgi:hypothetical protein